MAQEFHYFFRNLLINKPESISKIEKSQTSKLSNGILRNANKHHLIEASVFPNVSVR